MSAVVFLALSHSSRNSMNNQNWNICFRLWSSFHERNMKNHHGEWATAMASVWIQRVMMSPLWNGFMPYLSKTLLNKEFTEWVMCSESPSVRTLAARRCDYSDNPSSSGRLRWEEAHGKAETSHQTLQHSRRPQALSKPAMKIKFWVTPGGFFNVFK